MEIPEALVQKLRNEGCSLDVKILQEAFDELNERVQKVLNLRYGAGQLTLQEVGNECKMIPERVSQVEDKGLQQILIKLRMTQI